MIVRRIWPSLTHEHPFGELERMRRDMDRLFGLLEADALHGPPPGVFPAVNVTHDDENFYVRAELPGIDTKQLELSAMNNRLSLSGKREIQPPAEGTSCHRREREGGTFNRTVQLPTQFDTERVQASYVNGILTVTLPKSAERRPKQIPVQTG